jgi:hypothetical protein
MPRVWEGIVEGVIEKEDFRIESIIRKGLITFMVRNFRMVVVTNSVKVLIKRGLVR